MVMRTLCSLACLGVCSAFSGASHMVEPVLTTNGAGQGGADTIMEAVVAIGTQLEGVFANHGDDLATFEDNVKDDITGYQTGLTDLLTGPGPDAPAGTPDTSILGDAESDIAELEGLVDDIDALLNSILANMEIAMQ